jgi:hypothetical protein
MLQPSLFRVPRHGRPPRRPTGIAARRGPGVVGLGVAGLTLVGLTLLAGCGGNSDRSLPDARPPALDTLAPAQIVNEAQRALASARSVHITGEYRENNMPVQVDMRIAAGNTAAGTVTSNGASVEVRRLGDQLYVKGDDTFLAALGDKAKATKGKWLVGPIAQADRGLANLTDLQSFSGTLTPGSGALRKEAVRSFAGQQAVSVLNPVGARLWVADTGTPYPLRIERLGAVVGFLDYRDYDVPVQVKAPSPTVPLASISS